jgi:hypothetical protein
MQRALPVVLLTLLVVLSGCSFLGGTPTPEPGAGSPTADGTPSPTAPPTASPTPEQSSFPSGFSATGVTDADAAVRGHVDALVDAGSFYVQYNATADSENRSARIGTFQAANLTDRRAFVVTRVADGATRMQYHEGDDVYVRAIPPDGDPQYSTDETAFDPERFAGLNTVEPLLRHAEYGNATTLERNGDTIYRYRAVRITDIESILGRDVDPGNVSSFVSEFEVDADGIVRRAAYRATIDRPGGTVTVEVRIRVLGYGSTTVGEPTWLDEASGS